MGKAKTKFSLSNFNTEKNRWQKFTWSPILGWAWPSISLTRIIQQLIQLLGSLLKIPTLLKSEGGCILKTQVWQLSNMKQNFHQECTMVLLKILLRYNFFQSKCLISYLMIDVWYYTLHMVQYLKTHFVSSYAIYQFCQIRTSVLHCVMLS